MSVVGEGRDTKNTSVYRDRTTDKDGWLCDIKFFKDNQFATEIIIVGKERMNVIGEIYENKKFMKLVEIISEKNFKLGEYSKIKEQIIIEGFKEGLKVARKAIEIYETFNIH